MSRSRKDGKDGGGHKDKRNRELWSRRCHKVNMDTPDKWSKMVTHRYERRVGKNEIKEMLDDTTRN